VAVVRKDIKVGMVVAEVKMAAEGQVVVVRGELVAAEEWLVVKVEMSTVKVENLEMIV
jgi:hypothetical protein